MSRLVGWQGKQVTGYNFQPSDILHLAIRKDANAATQTHTHLRGFQTLIFCQSAQADFVRIASEFYCEAMVQDVSLPTFQPSTFLY